MSQSALNTIDNFRLSGKVALVTGASRGIGRALAEALAGAGADVILNARDHSRLEETAKFIRSETGVRVDTLVADVSEPDFPEVLDNLVSRTSGKLDILMNNAGLNRRGPSLDFSSEDWDFVMDVNLKAPFRVAQACAAYMIKQGGGKIIITLSLASRMGLATVPAYSASKGGLALLTKTLAVEWAQYDICVNGIGPGFIRTDMNQAIQDGFRSRWVVNRTPMGRWGETFELAGAALFLASPASNFMTGQVVYVDGGFLAGSNWMIQG